MEKHLSRHMGTTKQQHTHKKDSMNAGRQDTNSVWRSNVAPFGLDIFRCSWLTLETCYFMHAVMAKLLCLHVYTHSSLFLSQLLPWLAQGRPHAAMDQRSSLEMTPVVGSPGWPHRRPTALLRSTRPWLQQRHGIGDVVQSYLDWYQWKLQNLHLNLWILRKVAKYIFLSGSWGKAKESQHIQKMKVGENWWTIASNFGSKTCLSKPVALHYFLLLVSWESKGTPHCTPPKK